MIVLGLGVLYHVAVGQPKQARFGVVTPGALVATLLWLIASGLFAVYTANFASYSKTYGSLASIVVVLLWLYLSAIAVLIGAEIDGVARPHPHALPDRTSAVCVPRISSMARTSRVAFLAVRP